MNKNEQEIIRQIRYGQAPQACNQFVRMYGTSLQTFIFCIVPVREDAEELLQDTFIKAIQHIDRLTQADASVLTWLRRIAYREILHYFRKQRSMPVIMDFANATCQNISEEQVDELLSEGGSEIFLLKKAILMLSPDEQH